MVVQVATPRRLGIYELGERIGEGGVAEVFVATNPSAGVRRTLVIKRVRHELRANAELERAFAREAAIAQRLRHGNVVAVVDAGDDDGVPYLVLEHVDGCPLHDLLHDGDVARPLAPVVAVYVAEQVALALAYVHGLVDDDGRPLALVHRDVTPGNILCSREGLVKLTDFGIAHAAALGSDTLPGFIKGTPQYLAPEQAAGRPVDARADLFALGLVLRRMLVGDGDLDRIDPELRALVEHATEPAVRDRIASAERFAARLQAWRAAGERAGGAAMLAELVRARTGRPAAVVRPLDLGGAGAAATRQLPAAVQPDTAVRRRWIVALGLAGAIVVGVAWSARTSDEQPRTSLPAPEPSAPPSDPPPTPSPPRETTTTDAPTAAPERVEDPPAPPSKAPPRRRARGELRVNVLPYAEIRIDGRARGRTPLSTPLDAGTHTIELYNPDVPQRRSKTIRIAAGEQVSVTEW